jgi:hypothetical protein
MASFASATGSAITATLTPADIDGLPSTQLQHVTAALREESELLKRFIAAEDAAAVEKATHGLGTDEARLVRAARLLACLCKGRVQHRTCAHTYTALLRCFPFYDLPNRLRSFASAQK